MPDIKRSLRRPDGSVDTKAILALKKDDLKEWLRRRFEGRDPYLPLGRSEELPHTLLAQLYAGADPTEPFRERLHQVAGELLEEALGAGGAPFAAECLAETLDLARSVGLRVRRALLVRAWESGVFSQGAYGEARIDVQLLDLLAAQEALQPIRFWMEGLNTPRYALVALRALERYGPEAVASGLPALIATLRGDLALGEPAFRLALPLKRLVERFGLERLEPLLERQLNEADRAVVEGAARLVDVSLRLAPADGLPRLSVDEVRRGIRSPALLRRFDGLLAASALPRHPVLRAAWA